MSYEEAFRKYYPMIVKFCITRLDAHASYAEDVASNAFVMLLEKWDALRSHEEKVIASWLYRVAHYKLQEFYRDQKLQPTLSFDDEEIREHLEEQLADSPSAVDTIEYEKYTVYMKQIKRALKAEERLVFCYVVEQRLPFHTVAAKLQISLSAAKMRWYRMQNKLRSLIQDLIEADL